MPAIDVPGGTIYYVEAHGAARTSAGSAPPLVLVHGAGGSRLDWPAELRRLPGARVIALDLPGHGKSAGPARETIDAYAADVVALLDALRLPRAVIVGHSMGGGIAQTIALDWPDRVAGLALLGTGSKLPVAPTLPQRIVDAPAATIDWMIEQAWHPDAPDTLKETGRRTFRAVPPRVVRGDYLACQAFDVRDRLGAIAAPALVIAASDDRMVPLKFSRTLAERIPAARLVVIEGAGHMFPLEKPQLVAAAVHEWMVEQSWSD